MKSPLLNTLSISLCPFLLYADEDSSGLQDFVKTLSTINLEVNEQYSKTFSFKTHLTHEEVKKALLSNIGKGDWKESTSVISSATDDTKLTVLTNVRTNYSITILHEKTGSTANVRISYVTSSTTRLDKSRWEQPVLSE